jgi:hypothetical protein
LNLDDKPCNVDGNELVFLGGIDTNASDSGYPELDVDADLESWNDKVDRLKLEKWILTAIKERARKNNVCYGLGRGLDLTLTDRLGDRHLALRMHVPSELLKDSSVRITALLPLLPLLQF